MTYYAGRPVLVTGGASFIGSHLVELLLSEGASVRVADNLSSGRLENLRSVADRIEFIKGDLSQPEFAAACCDGMEVVFHLAASHGGRGYIDTHPVECCTNLILDGTVFAAANGAKVDRVCFASSACVYPTNLQSKEQVGPVFLREEWADPFVPGRAAADGEYGWAKLMGEMCLGAYHKQHGLRGVSCRIFTAYGERENETHAIIAFIARALAKADPYVVWGDGQQDRNFTYVGDIVRGLMRAAETVTDATPVNIGTSEHIKIIDAVQLVFELSGFRPKQLKYDLSKPVGVLSRAADLTRARSILGWEPKVSFADGLKRTMEWYFRTKDPEEINSRLDVLLTER